MPKSMSRGLRKGSIALLAASFTLTACGGSADGSGGAGGSNSGTEEPFKVLALLALSGPVAAVGTANQQGLEVAVDTFNEDGGIGGRQIELDVRDTGGAAENAAGLLQEVIADGKPDLVIAGSTSNETLALCPLLNRNEIVSVTVSSNFQVGDPATCQFNFSTSLSTAGNQEVFAEYLVDSDITDVGLLTANDAFGQGTVTAAEEAYADAGITVTGKEEFALDALDISTQWSRLQGGNPDLVFLEGQGAAIAHALEGRAKVGWDVPVVLGPGASSTTTASALDESAREGVQQFTYTVNVRGAEPSPDLLEQFVSAIEEKNGGEYPVPLNIYTMGYDQIAMMVAAAEVAGATDTQALTGALTGFGDEAPADAPWLTRANFAFTSDLHFSKPGDLTAALFQVSEGGQFDPAE